MIRKLFFATWDVGGFKKFLRCTISVYFKPSTGQLRNQTSMGFQIGYDKVVSFTRLSVYLACTWPPSSSATKWQIVRYNTRWSLFFINGLWMFSGLVVSIYKHRENSLAVMQSACFAGSMVNMMIKMIVYRIYFKPTQSQIEEMEDFLSNARPHERMVLQSYSAKFSLLQTSIVVMAYFTSFMVTIAPLFLPHQPLPSMAVYPFSVVSGVGWSFAFIQQAIISFQCSSANAIIDQGALLMWFAGARLEILAGKTKRISEVKGIPDLVEEHKKRLAYAVAVSKTMRYVALASSMVSGFSAIMSTLLLSSNHPLLDKISFMPISIVAVVNLFMCAWPADNLINVCHSLGNAVYDISWFDMPVGSRKNLLIIIQRCQRPVTVSVGGLLPILSLRSYAAFLSAVFSYFMTLRAATSEKAN